MANQEQKLAIWRDLGKEFGTPVKDSDEYYRKMEVYYQILEDINQSPPPPPPQRMPVQVRREEPELDSRQRGECCCDCHRKGDRAPVPVRRRVIKCDSSDSEESEFGDVRLARRARRVILTSDDESDSDSDSDSDDEPIRKKKPVGRPSKKKSTTAQKKKVEKEEKNKKKTLTSAPKKKQTAKVSRS